MVNINLTLFKSNKLYTRLIGHTILAIVGLMFGLIPEVSLKSQNLNGVSSPSIALRVSAYAQQFTPEETENYAQAGYEVELLRREVYQEIKNLINEPPPEIVCDRQETFDNLEPKVREIAENYCSQSQEIVRQNNLTVDRFNELKTYYDLQDDFYEQVQGILLKLQN
ncbi:DUF4168 domain-containing protein [Pleurocapsales cyanobacterium LEGE 10410]|nr:DUF4168 domain-containing protein [Pleurocapsales cyanobacterium LEGE 10410]